MRVLRHAPGRDVGRACGHGRTHPRPGDPQDRHDRLLGPQGLDGPRRTTRFRVAARGHDPLLRGDAGRARGARRHDREVHRRRDHGRLRPADPPRGRRAPGRPGRSGHATGTRPAERRPRATLGRPPLEPHRRLHGRGRGRRPDRRPAARHGRPGQHGRPPRAGGADRPGPHRRADLPPGPRLGGRRGRRTARAQGQGRTGAGIPTPGGPSGGRPAPRRRGCGRIADGRPGGRDGAVARGLRHGRGRSYPPHGHDRRRRRRREVAADPGVPRVGGRRRLHRSRALPALRPRHHVLADRGDRARGRRDRRRRPARARPGQAARPHRRRRDRRAARLGHGPERRGVPARRSVLGRPPPR